MLTFFHVTYEKVLFRACCLIFIDLCFSFILSIVLFLSGGLHLHRMMGSFRRPRPRFMSSPVLSDLARFHASSPTLQLSNASVWNSVQTAVIKVFQGGGLQANELYSLNESIRWLQRTELGSFITEYFQDQLLNKGLACILEKIQLHEDENWLQALSEMWVAFFTEILPTLQAIFYPVQGIHEPGGPSKEYYLLERLVDMVISPYLSNYLYMSHRDTTSDCHLEQSKLTSSPHYGQPEITVTHFAPESLLAPLVEHEGEAYLERTGGVRRHTVANVQSDIQLLSVTNKMHTGEADGSGNGQGTKSGRCGSPRPRSAASESLRRQSPAHMSCELAS
ncbi:proline-rich protein 5-like isoform X4 [Colossoma macropomum]|uniref:proline-rich protein 5-like isoform X4 n=1 Tax=Colossoma macropomum TaxID=42526 RepID=UPI0018654DF1|nr:proline-rich protein 5-like isoform X4 [Colossoma macropomum]